MAAQAQDAIPPALREWQGWVLHGEEFRRCPFAASADAAARRAHRRRRIPLRLARAPDAGRRRARRHLLAALAGVRRELGGAARQYRALAARRAAQWRAGGGGRASTTCPSLRLAPGSYTVSGRFEWSSRPESLPLPRRHRHRRSVRRRHARGAAGAAGRRRVAGQAPQRRAGRRHGSAGLSPGAGRDPRLSTDAHPPQRGRRSARRGARRARCPTASRRCRCAAICPRASSATARLRVQLRAGSHEVIAGRARHRRGEHAGAPGQRGGKWPREEIWSFAANDALRVAAAEGAEGIDPAQANVPGEWRQYPAFRMDAAAKLNVVERSRGLSNADDNRLSLTRNAVARLRSSRIHGGRPHPRASCAATGGSTCRRRSRCRARARTTISCS